MRTFVVLLLLLLLVSTCFALSKTVVSNDIVPAGDWTYDALASLAADGMVPGFSARVFTGDRLLSRADMAKVVASAAGSCANGGSSDKHALLLDKLIKEFKAELREVNVVLVEDWLSDAELPDGSHVFPMVRISALANDRGNAVVPYRASVYADLSPSVFVMATASDRERKFFCGERGGDFPDKAFVRFFGDNFVWSAGKEHLRWGPGYSGSVILSDNTPALTQVRASGDVYLGKFLGKIRLTQFASSFVDQGETVYLLGRRYERKLSECTTLGVSETAKIGIVPNPLILIMPFYLYQELFMEVDAQFNALYAIDLSCRSGGMQVYGEAMVDDMTAPIFGAGYDRPRKIGYVLGVNIGDASKPKASTLRAEYIFVDRLAYEATREDHPEMAYTYDGCVIGHPVGQNGNAVYLRGERYLSDNLSAVAEYYNRRQSDPDDPQTGSEYYVSVLLCYDIDSRSSVSVRAMPYKTIVGGGYEDSGTVWEFRFTSVY